MTWDQGLEMKIEFDELACQNGICTWTELTVGLGTPRLYPIAMVVPKLMDCQTTPTVCEHPTWIGDGYCNDVINTESCNYDGGDCCGSSIDTTYCIECQCCDIGGCNATINGGNGGNIIEYVFYKEI